MSVSAEPRSKKRSRNALAQPGLFDGFAPREAPTVSEASEPPLGLFANGPMPDRAIMHVSGKPAQTQLSALRSDGGIRADGGPEVYRLRDLMQMFGYADVNSFRAWRRRTEAHGFPAPLPGCSRPLKWDRRQVDTWRSRVRTATRPMSELETSPTPVDIIALAREKLRRKAALRP